MNQAHLLLRSARWLPDRPAIAVGKRVLHSYRSLSERVARLSAGIVKTFKLEPGDRVAIAMKNCPEYWEVLFAIWHAGLAAVPMNAKLHPKELEYILEHSGAKLCFYSEDLEVPFGSLVSISSPEFKSLEGEPQAPFDSKPEDLAWLFYTSG